MSLSILETAVVAIQTVVSQSTDRLEATLTEHRLTPATAQALWAIDPAEQPPSMKTIAQRLFCNAPNLTFVVNQLVDRGLVERKIDPADRRSRLIVLTESGHRARSKVIDAALVVTPLANVSPTALQQLVDILGNALQSPFSEAR